MNDTLLSQYFCSIRPGYISTYYEPLERKPPSFRELENRENLLYNWHRGEISKKARVKIRNVIDWLVFLSTNKFAYEKKTGKKVRFKLSFITLTLASPQIHSDFVIKYMLLNHFLIEFSKKFNVDMYVWRAESQKNGRIHFHITTNKFVPWWLVRDMWNRIQDKLGYVSRYRQRMDVFFKDGFKVRNDLLDSWSLEDQKKAYKKGISNNWCDPNSVDVHPVRKDKDISWYLSKEFTKNLPTGNNGSHPLSCSVQYIYNKKLFLDFKELKEYGEYRPISGRLWGCSSKLSKLRSASFEMSPECSEEIFDIQHKYSHKVRESEYFKVIYVNINDWSKFNGVNLFEQFSKYLGLFGYDVSLN